MQWVVVKVAQVKPWPEAPVPLHLWPPLRLHTLARETKKQATFHFDFS